METKNLAEIVGKGYASFWKSKKRYRVVKGGRGSKKSFTAALWYIYNMLKYPDSNVLVVRKTMNTHKDSTFATLKWAAERLGVSHIFSFKENPLEIQIKATGQKMLFRGLDEPLKLTSIMVQHGVLCWVWFEEVFEIENEKDFEVVDESIRGNMPNGLWKQLTLTYNPWVSSHWTKERFWDNTDPQAFTLTTTYKDNEFLDQQDINKIEGLRATNPERFKVVGLGEYGSAGQTYFSEFRHDIHVLNSFVIPDYWKRYRVLDYGLDMLACYWIAMDTRNRAYVYRELAESGLIVSEAAKNIIEYTADDKIYDTIGPPDMRSRQKDTGRSMMEVFSDNGINLNISSNLRIAGWMDMREWLRVYDTVDEITGQPKLDTSFKVFSCCKQLINSLDNICEDEKDPNDVAEEPHFLTHYVDAIRYWCAGRPSPSREMAKPQKVKFIEEFKKKKELLESKNKLVKGASRA